MTNYYYNITKTEKGILIHDRFFTHDFDGFIHNYGKNETGVPTNLGDLKLEAIQMSKMQIETDPDPDDIFFIIEDVVFSLNNEDFYYYRDWADISKICYSFAEDLGCKMAPLPNIKRGGFIKKDFKLTDDFELLPCKKSYDKPVFIID